MTLRRAWPETRLRFVVRLNPSKSELERAGPDVEVSFLPMDAIGDDGSLRLDTTRPLGEVQTGYSYFRDGDVVVAKITPCFENGKGALMQGLLGGVGFGTTELIVARPEPGIADGGFLNWLFQAPDFRRAGEGAMYGAGGQKRVPDDFVRDYRVALPPLAEQTAIAAFLDGETGKIDALVEEQRRLIELLKEKRQALISHAVTKGLDPNAKMKPSGVEWLGDVPEHWEVGPLRYHLHSISSGTSVNAVDTPAEMGEPGVLKTSCVYSGEFDPAENKAVLPEEWDRVTCPLEVGSIIVSRMNTPDLVGAAGLVERPAEGIYLPDRLWQVRIGGFAPFFHYWMQSAAYRYQVRVACAGTSSSMQNLGQDQFRAFLLGVPSPGEQQEIASYLKSHLKKFDALMAEAEEAIRLLGERRAALISAAVTGKIDVRGTSAVKTADRSRFRLIVGAEIVERLAHKKAFGRVKLQKLLYLAEADAGISELKGEYVREAAGPLDRDLIADVEARLQGHVEVAQQGGPGSPVTYRVLGAKGTYRQELAALLGDRREALDRLIELLGDMDTLQVEAITTLYAVWNDAVLDGRQPNDVEIISGVLEDWHPEKAKKFRAVELDVWLGWMKRNHLVPRGSGPRTVTGRLFA